MNLQLLPTVEHAKFGQGYLNPLRHAVEWGHDKLVQVVLDYLGSIPVKKVMIASMKQFDYEIMIINTIRVRNVQQFGLLTDFYNDHDIEPLPPKYNNWLRQAVTGTTHDIELIKTVLTLSPDGAEKVTCHSWDRACRSGNLAVVQTLLDDGEVGQNINTRNELRLPLMNVIRNTPKKSTHIIEAIIDAGADANVLIRRGATLPAHNHKAFCLANKKTYNFLRKAKIEQTGVDVTEYEHHLPYPFNEGFQDSPILGKAMVQLARYYNLASDFTIKFHLTSNLSQGKSSAICAVLLTFCPRLSCLDFRLFQTNTHLYYKPVNALFCIDMQDFDGDEGKPLPNSSLSLNRITRFKVPAANLETLAFFEFRNLKVLGVDVTTKLNKSNALAPVPGLRSFFRPMCLEKLIVRADYWEASQDVEVFSWMEDLFLYLQHKEDSTANLSSLRVAELDLNPYPGFHQDAGSLCRVSRKLGSVAREILYTSINCPWLIDDVVCLLRTLLENHELAEKVKDFQCYLTLNETNWGLPRDTLNTPEVIGKALKHIVHHLEYVLDDTVIACLARGFIGNSAIAFTALVITLLPQLSSLSFCLNQYDDEDTVYHNPTGALY
ncbi:hypothetical protein EK21DRAFT_110030 [Setomelanomma holmii]|uniref:Uncharacterized protein n=1 Tax=Setomelanomma holmii TaxID=210430 RepID=A0A9P4LPM3_9PLEO|nr:hypothetical protein EK21DRAFT_110030 [Setomelanomma holmii]